MWFNYFLKARKNTERSSLWKEISIMSVHVGCRLIFFLSIVGNFLSRFVSTQNFSLSVFLSCVLFYLKRIKVSASFYSFYTVITVKLIHQVASHIKWPVSPAMDLKNYFKFNLFWEGTFHKPLRPILIIPTKTF